MRLSLLVVVLALGCRAESGALPGAGPLTSVPALDLERYAGTWYEIARYPHSFEDGLVGVTAQYAVKDDGDVRVANVGREGTLDGEMERDTARAWVPDRAEPARLKVRFFWPMAAPYWVIALDPDYQWSVVGEPGRRYLWVLSRTPELPEETYAAILQRIHALGYDETRLELTPQPPATPPPPLED